MDGTASRTVPGPLAGRRAVAGLQKKHGRLHAPSAGPAPRGTRRSFIIITTNARYDRRRPPDRGGSPAKGGRRYFPRPVQSLTDAVGSELEKVHASGCTGTWLTPALSSLERRSVYSSQPSRILGRRVNGGESSARPPSRLGTALPIDRKGPAASLPKGVGKKGDAARGAENRRGPPRVSATRRVQVARLPLTAADQPCC